MTSWKDYEDKVPCARHNWHGQRIQTLETMIESPESYPLSHDNSSPKKNMHLYKLTWKYICEKTWNDCIESLCCIRAVYTGIKKPEFFSHSGFSLEVARQLPLNTGKTRIENPPPKCFFFGNSAGVSLVFCQCKRLLPSHRYYSGFWSRGT